MVIRNINKIVSGYIKVAIALLLITGCSIEHKDTLAGFLLSHELSRYFYFTRTDAGAPLESYYRPRDTLVRLIDQASATIDIWCYGFDEPGIIAALLRARARGVKITITGEESITYTELQTAGLGVQTRLRSGLQHVKMVLIDGKVMFSGTGNLTESGFFHNNNAFFHIPLTSSQNKNITNLLSAETSMNLPVTNLLFGGRMLTAPLRGRLIQSQIIQAILSARYRIRFMIFSHTDPVITSALYLKAKQGVAVEGIFDTPGESTYIKPTGLGGLLNSRLGLLPSAIYADGNTAVFEKEPGEFHGGHLHHKTLIIDDHRVLTGSYNWSRSARDKNLEVMFDFYNPAVANIFAMEFDRVRSQAYIQARPPLTDSNQDVKLYSQNNRICLNGEHSFENGITIFSEQGPYFQARHFRNMVLQPENCFLLQSQDAISAGAQQGKYYLLPEDMDQEELTYYVFNLDKVRSRLPAATLPCEKPETCQRAKTNRISFVDGWIWLDENSGESFNNLIAWSKTGLSDQIALESIDADFYVFQKNTVKGDAIIFLEDAQNRYHIGCVQYGAALDSTPVNFLDAFEWITGWRPECVAGE